MVKANIWHILRHVTIMLAIIDVVLRGFNGWVVLFLLLVWVLVTLDHEASVRKGESK